MKSALKITTIIFVLGFMLCGNVFGDVIFSDDFSGDLSQWDFFDHCVTATITNTDGLPSPCLLVDDGWNYGCQAQTTQTFDYANKTMEFSTDLKHGNGGDANTKYAQLFLYKSLGSIDQENILEIVVTGSTNQTVPNRVYLAIRYDDNGVERKEDVGYQFPIANGDIWNNIKVRIRSDGKVKLYINGEYRYTTTHAITDAYSGQAVLGAGGRRSLYDNVKVEDLGGGEADSDGDGVPDDVDNCSLQPNGPNLGTCITRPHYGESCTSNSDCDDDAIKLLFGISGECSMNNENNDGDEWGDACDNCPYTETDNQNDSDDNGIGDACQVDSEYLLSGYELCDSYYDEAELTAYYPAPNGIHYFSTEEPVILGGENCMGRCGPGCGSLFPWLACDYEVKSTQACLNHDVCVGEYGYGALICNIVGAAALVDCNNASVCTYSAIAELIEVIESLNLDDKMEKKLLKKVEKAQKKLGEGKTDKAIKELQKFIKKVNKALKHEKISEEDADMLIQYATNIINSL